MTKHAEGYKDFKAAVAEMLTARPDEEAQIQIRLINALMPAAIETANELEKAGFDRGKIITSLGIAMGLVLASSIGSAVKNPNEALDHILPIHNKTARDAAKVKFE